MAIRREIYVTQKRLDVLIDVTRGTDMLPIELKVADYTIPDGAVATAYALGKSSEPKEQLCSISDNTVCFTPTSTFFEEGSNALQIRITHNGRNLIAFKTNVRCEGTIVSDDAQTAEENKLVVTQILSEYGEMQSKLDNALQELENISTHDLQDNTVTFTSSDNAAGDALLSVEVLKTGEKMSSILAKVSRIFNNVRYLISELGRTDISKIGDGTVTGAINALMTKHNELNNRFVVATYTTGELNSWETVGDIPDGMTLDKSVIVGYTVRSSDGTWRTNPPGITLFAESAGIVARSIESLYVNQTIVIIFMRI